MKKQIVIVGFNRPLCIEKVLASLLNQSVVLNEYDVHLFIDGPRDFNDSILIENVKSIFSKFFPDGFIHASPFNLGIAKNFLRIYEYFFETMHFPYLIVLEDDLVLSSEYVRTLEKLTSISLSDSRVGICACYGEIAARSIEEQIKFKSNVDSLGHNWGFSITKNAWDLAKQSYFEYQDLISGVDYRNIEICRVEIQSLFLRMGFVYHELSQDVALTLALLNNNIIKINTIINLAEYIGFEGEHFKKENVEFNTRFKNLILYKDKIPDKFFFADSDYLAILDGLRTHFNYQGGG